MSAARVYTKCLARLLNVLLCARRPIQLPLPPSLTLTPSLSEVNTKQSKFLFEELHDSRLLQDSPNLAGRFLPRSGPLIPSDLLSSYDPIVRLFHLNYFRAENAQKFIARASDIFRVKRLAASGWGIGGRKQDEQT